MITQEQREFRDALIQRRDDALEVGDNHWNITPEEFKMAVELGVQGFGRVRLDFEKIIGFDIPFAQFHSADLENTVFQDCSMNAHFRDAFLDEAKFINVNLRGSVFAQANLNDAVFNNCDLKNVDFSQANLDGVEGLKTISPVGLSGRLIYAYVFNGVIRIQAGCRNANPDDMRKAILNTYANNPRFQADYLDAVDLLEKWGNREIARLNPPQVAE